MQNYEDDSPQGGDKRILRVLPIEYRKQVAFFWACNSHLLASPLPLVMRLKYWLVKCEITTQELGEIFNRLMSPASCAELRFPGDLLAAVASEIDQTLKRKRQQKEAEERRTESTSVMSPDDMQKLRQLLDGELFQKPKEKPSE